MWVRIGIGYPKGIEELVSYLPKGTEFIVKGVGKREWVVCPYLKPPALILPERPAGAA